MLSAAILTRNLLDATEMRLGELQRFGVPKDEIFIVDAGSVKRELHPQTTISVNSPEVVANGLRFCRGMNLALAHWLKHSETDWILLLPVDYELLSLDWRRLKDVLSSHEEIALVAPIQEASEQADLMADSVLRIAWQFDDGPLLVSRKLWASWDPLNNKAHSLFDEANFRSILYSVQASFAVLFLGFVPALTSAIITRENESFLSSQHAEIRTEERELHLDLARAEFSERLYEVHGTHDSWFLLRAVDALFQKFLSENPHFDSLTIKELLP